MCTWENLGTEENPDIRKTDDCGDPNCPTSTASSGWEPVNDS